MDIFLRHGVGCLNKKAHIGNSDRCFWQLFIVVANFATAQNKKSKKRTIARHIKKIYKDEEVLKID